MIQQTAKDPIDGHTAENAVRAWIEPCARAGFAVRALLYGTIGILAAQFAVGLGGETTDVQGAIEAIGAQQLGTVLLVLVVLGLAGYAIWRFVQGIADTEEKGNDLKGLAVRASYIGSGLLNAGLAVVAARILLGDHSGNDNGLLREWTQRLLLTPAGTVAVGIIGGAVACGGLYQFYKAFSEKFRKPLATHKMSSPTDRWTSRIAKVGLSARGVVYTLAGIFLMRAAFKADPHEARGADEVLDEIVRQPYGSWLLGAMALGFLAYAAYALVNAIYRRIETGEYAD